MQKIRNRSLFFQKISHIRYIAKNFESVQALSGILPKILKTFSLFRTFFKKSFYGILWQTGHRHFNNTLCANSPNSPNLPSTGVISKTTPRCVAAFGKNSEKHHHYTTDYQFFIPETLHCFQKKLKNFYFLTYHITDLELFLSHFRLKSKLQRSVLHSPSTGVISKICPSCAVVFRKNLKKTSPLHH